MQALSTKKPARISPAWRWLLLAGGLWAGGGLLTVARAEPAAVPLAEVDARFRATDPAVCMEYDVGYRFLHIELRRIGKIVATTTIGKWQHRVKGVEVPALFLDMRADSPDNGVKGQRNRVSIHDRMVAVLTIPDLEVLLFSKYSDEYLHPLIGRVRETLSCSMYNTESGRLDYEDHDLKSGMVSTNLANPEALLELSRRIRPVMNFLINQCAKKSPEAGLADPERIVVNMDGRVVALRLVTHLERSFACLGRRKFEALHVSTATERGSSIKPRNFHAWCLPFESLAEQQGDPGLVTAAREAPVPSVVPLVLNYELGLGNVRATMTAIHLGRAGCTNSVSLPPEGPPATEAGKDDERRHPATSK